MNTETQNPRLILYVQPPRFWDGEETVCDEEEADRIKSYLREKLSSEFILEESKHSPIELILVTAEAYQEALVVIKILLGMVGAIALEKFIELFIEDIYKAIKEIFQAEKHNKKINRRVRIHFQKESISYELDLDSTDQEPTREQIEKAFSKLPPSVEQIEQVLIPNTANEMEISMFYTFESANWECYDFVKKQLRTKSTRKELS